MKKKQKKLKKKKKISKKISKNKKVKRIKKLKKIHKSKTKKSKQKKIKKVKKIKENLKSTKAKKDSIALKLVKWQLSLKPKLNLNLNFNLEKYIQGFFDKIANFIDQYRVIKKDEARRIKVEKQENERLEKIKIAEEKQKQEDLKFK